MHGHYALYIENEKITAWMEHDYIVILECTFLVSIQYKYNKKNKETIRMHSVKMHGILCGKLW
jgi:hypothetical protein